MNHKTKCAVDGCGEYSFSVDGTVYCGDCARALEGAETLLSNDLTPLEAQVGDDPVQKPSHYQVFPGLEAIQVIAMICTKQEFYGYCKGNMLKYRLRAGNKDDLAQDIGKANMYLDLYKKHKYLCKPRE